MVRKARVGFGAVILLICLGLSAGPRGAAAEETLPGKGAGSGTESGIADVIGQQIAAFRADDFGLAFTFASPTIHQMFGTAENFGLMVRQGYPMVHRPARVDMLDQRTEGEAVWQRVMIRDASGATHFLDYQMIETPDGWRINAVILLPSAGIGA